MERRRVVVLASGDPLLFGIGARMVAAIGKDRVVVLPNVSSIAAAFARIRQPWDSARMVSLHGRDRRFALLDALKGHAPVAVLTDPEQSPDRLAAWLLERGIDRLRMAVFERLGDPQERVAWYSLAAAAGKRFTQPNLAVLMPEAGGKTDAAPLRLGMPEAAYRHEKGLITKSEVRAVTLARLMLGQGMTLWDLGAGSGAVGIEASLLIGDGRIVALEKKPERVAQIRANAIDFGVYNHAVIQAELPDGLAGLPAPDRIFIGGGGQDLTAIVREAGRYLQPGGIVVVNTVLLDNLGRITATMEEIGLAVDVIQMQVNHSRPMPWSARMEARNPVWIIQGRAKECP
jgi:precorrin-6Y C5,15-methyltransferase (decarboxylating)